MENMIGLRIKTRRKELKISGAQIKEKTGISTGNLSDIENGKVLPSAIALMQLSKTLGCSTDYILFGETLNSEHSHIRDDMFLCKSEENLINNFRELSDIDKEELIEILQMKLRRSQKAREINAQSSLSTSNETDNMVG